MYTYLAQAWQVSIQGRP